MCGRFSLFSSFEDIIQAFDVEKMINDEEYTKTYNIAPTHNIISIINDGHVNRMGHLSWGLIPRWSKDPKIRTKMINARSETVDEKPSFRESFNRRRCLIPMDSFFEWQQTSSSKQPYRIKMKNDQLFAVAGLWDTWYSQTGKKVNSCTMLTTSPNELMSTLHHRMPVILPQKEYETWLNPREQDTQLLRSLLVPYPASDMEAYAVSTAVNSVRNNDQSLIQQIS
ncbi:SOS response-associated peptidase [Viridibacillus arvi]|uniref:SOS response-associated peptidase n=1 Tax=Viridibacillus arvi TaxID=263475 RepID=UPI00187B8C8D|nr:SOS response-associated peptidase [Viridibacillus sp. JNUCC-6]QOV11575.1 SOS response-associated peptidase [Viridibacillus sp. JNUCC-6]